MGKNIKYAMIVLSTKLNIHRQFGYNWRGLSKHYLVSDWLFNRRPGNNFVLSVKRFNLANVNNYVACNDQWPSHFNIHGDDYSFTSDGIICGPQNSPRYVPNFHDQYGNCNEFGGLLDDWRSQIKLVGCATDAPSRTYNTSTLQLLAT